MVALLSIYRVVLDPGVSAGQLRTGRCVAEACIDVFGAKIFRSPLYGALDIVVLAQMVAVSFAMTGHMSPLLAAILMPLSSMTVVLSSYRAKTF